MTLIKKTWNERRRIATVVVWGVICFASSLGCEDLEVADYNSEFRAAPTIERAPTLESAPTVEAAPTIAKFEGFETAPTVKAFEGFEQAPTATRFEGFSKAPTVTQFRGFSDDDDPCTIFLDNPSPENAERAAEWAMGHLDGAGGDIDADDGARVAAACQVVLAGRQ